MRNWIVSQFRTFRRVYTWWRDQLTTMGKLIFMVMIVSLPALADSGAVLAIVFIASSVILFGASTASYVFRPRLVVRVACPENWMQREARLLQLRVTNVSRRALIDVRLELLPRKGIWEIIESLTAVAIIQPGETITVPARVRPLRRGQIRLPSLRATTLFPLQLVRRTETCRHTGEALILPFYRELHSLRLAESTASFSRGSNLALQTVGLTGEYVGSREYQPGVPVRKWDYASWARLGQPVVREFSEPRHPSAAVVLDSFFPPADAKPGRVLPELEAMLSLTAAITSALIAERNRIDLLAVGDQLLTIHGRFSGEDHLLILEQLALAHPCDPAGIPTLFQKIEDIPITWDLAVVVSHRWEKEQELLLDAVTRRIIGGTRVVVRPDQWSGHATPDDGVLNFTCRQIETGLLDL